MKPSDEFMKQLAQVGDECSNENWDGYDAEFVSEETVRMVKCFIEALPDDIPEPEIAPDPDGELSLDWYTDRRKTFSVSIGPYGKLSWAMLNGDISAHGSDEMTDSLTQTIPVDILNHIRSVL